MATLVKKKRSHGDWLVYSTQTNGTDFVQWKREENGSSVVERVVSIKGGANLARKSGELITPLGVVTEISQHDMDFLDINAAFIAAKHAGFFTVVKASGWPDHPDDVAADMKKQDGSAPRTPESYHPDKVPSVGSELPSAETTKPKRAKAQGMFR